MRRLIATAVAVLAISSVAWAADQTYIGPQGYPQVLVDNGDGTYSPKVSASVTVGDVTNAGTFAVQCDSGCSGGTQYDVGDAASATATGTAALVVRDDALGGLSDAEGDEVRLRVDANGALWAVINGTTTVALSATDNQVLDAIAAAADAIQAATEAIQTAAESIDAKDLVLGSDLAATGTAGSMGADYSSVQLHEGAYETIAASATAQVMGATGATGDYLDHLTCFPATTSPGNVIILDNATTVATFAGGTTSVSNLVPFTIPVGLYSVSGAWKITTGTNVSCFAVGTFT